MVPVAVNDALADELRHAGVETQVVKIPFADHNFDVPTAIGAQIWRESSLRWFARNGA